MFIRTVFIDANFEGANLRNATFSGSILRGSNFTASDMQHSSLNECDLLEARFERADLRHASLYLARAIGTSFKDATMECADLTAATFVNANLRGATLRACRAYGVATWDLDLAGADQRDIVVVPKGSNLTVDDLEVGQFIYLLLKNARLRAIIDTITSRVVLILGRFTPDRKGVLDAIREKLRGHNYCPIMFDFDTPNSRDTQETVSTLAHLARFIIADLTEPRSIPQELTAIVQALPSVPIQPLLLKGQEPWGMFDHMRKFPWVLPVHEYGSPEQLLTDLDYYVIGPAETWLSKRTQTIA
jgi:hypothetical protein